MIARILTVALMAVTTLAACQGEARPPRLILVYELEGDAALAAPTAEAMQRRLDAHAGAGGHVVVDENGRVVVDAPAGVAELPRLKRNLERSGRLSLHVILDAASDASMTVETGDPDEPFIIVRSQAALTQADVSEARIDLRLDAGEVAIALAFDAAGADILCALGRERQGAWVAVLFDARLLAVAPLNAAGCETDLTVMGGFSPAEAADAVMVLNAGVLPASVRLVDERIIVPNS